MNDPEVLPDDDESENFDSQESICRSRSGTMKTEHLSTDQSINADKNKKRRKIRNCIIYVLVGLLIATGTLVPILYSMMKKPPIYYVSHGITKPPGSIRTRTTTTGITTTPFDQCDRRFVALTKKLEQYINSVATADLNNDNKTDIVFICEQDERVHIVFNLGNDKFDDPKSYSTTGSASSMIIADVNGDNYLDIIVGLSRKMHSINIFLNNGNGTFDKMINFISSSEGIIYSVAVADINGDNKSDIIIANADENIIEVYLYKGADQFDAVKSYSVGRFPMSVTAADLNNDKKCDIIVANTKLDTISIFFNDGNGDFDDPIDYSFGIGPVFVTVADMNNDDGLDIIVVNYFSNNIVIHFNDGRGNFTRRTNFSDIVNPLSVALNDFNSDGSIDIIVPNYHSNNVAVFFNNKSGTFHTSTSYLTYPLPRAVAAADLNDDTKPDIILGSGKYLATILSRCWN